MNWRDTNDLYQWKNKLVQLDDSNDSYIIPSIDLNCLLDSYITLILEAQKRGIIYG
jgi:hypothetical protein